MSHKILAWTLIVLSSLFMLLSVVGIAAAWIYNEPLTRKVITQLQDIDSQLAQAQTTLQSSTAPTHTTEPREPRNSPCNLQPATQFANGTVSARRLTELVDRLGNRKFYSVRCIGHKCVTTEPTEGGTIFVNA